MTRALDGARRWRVVALGLCLCCLLSPLTGAAQDAEEINRAADMMVRLCVGGGHTETVSGTGAGGADVALRSLDVRGNIKGEFKISRSNAEGLSNGIDNAMSQLAADQADKVRACLKPVRDRLLNIMLPLPKSGANTVRPLARSAETAWVGAWQSDDITSPDWLQPFRVAIELHHFGPGVTGRVKVNDYWYTMQDLKLTNDSIGFYFESEMRSGKHDEERQSYKETYYGVRRGDTIQFEASDDAGGTPFRFVATRAR